VRQSLPTLILAFFIALLLSGCITTRIDIQPAATILLESKNLVKRQHWGEAQILLQQGIKWYPKNLALQKALTKVQLEWTNKKRRLEDWMLVYEIEGLLLKRPLLVSMSQSDPDDNLLQSRLEFLDTTLNSKRELLISCTEYQIDLDLRLARRCIESAKKIRISTQVKTLLAQIKEIQKGIKQVQTGIKFKKQALTRKESRNRDLTQARHHLQQKFYYDAITLLQPHFNQNNEDQEVKELMQQAVTGRDLQVLQLVSHGDRLYREEHIIQAVIVWKQAAVLNPTNDGIASRINRAQKVLDKLKEIRGKE